MNVETEPEAIANDRPATEDGTAPKEIVTDPVEDEVDPTLEVGDPDTDTDTSDDEGDEDEDGDFTDGDDDDVEGESDEDEYQFDFGGNKYNAPKKGTSKEAAEALQNYGNGLQTSYTKKFTALSEAHKVMENRVESVSKLESMNNQTLNEYAQGLSLKTEIAELEKIDLDPYLRSDDNRDHIEAQRIQNAIAQKTRQFNNHLNNVNQLGHQANEVQRQENVRRYVEGSAMMDKRIPNFSKSVAKDVVAYAVSKGVPEAHAATWPLNPFAAETTYKAMMWDKAQSKAKTGIRKTTNKKITPVIPVAPKKKGKGSGARKDPGKMSQGEYAVWYAKKYGKR